MSASMRERIVTAAAEALQRDQGPVVDREAVIEALAQHILEDCRDRDWPDESQVVIDGISSAIDECAQGDYDTVFDTVRERVHEEFTKEATAIALLAIKEMAAEARGAQEVEAA